MSLRDFVQAAMAAGTKASVDVLAPIRSVPLLDLVKEMQPELTSQLPKVAPTALFVLSAAAIHRVEPHLPSAQEVDVVVDFLVSKVGHFTTIDSAVEALSRLICWGLTNMTTVYCRGEVVTKVVGKVLARIQVQSMFGRSKTAAMDLVEAITNPNVIEVVAETCGRDFLSVFLTCVDGEREPELVLLTALLPGRCSKMLSTPLCCSPSSTSTASPSCLLSSPVPLHQPSMTLWPCCEPSIHPHPRGMLPTHPHCSSPTSQTPLPYFEARWLIWCS